MKLSSVLDLLNQAYPLLHSFSVRTITLNGVEYSQVSNVKNVRRAIQQLKSTNIFDDTIAELENTVFYSVTEEETYIRPNEFISLKGILDNLVTVVLNVKKALENIVPEVPENTVYIKLPEIADLEGFRKSVDAFNKILTITILDPKIGGEIVFLGVESGSNWFKVFVKSTTAISLLGSLMWSGAVVYKKYQEGKMVEQYVREKKLQNDHKQNLVSAHKLLMDMTIDAEASIIYQKYYNGEIIDNEQLERIKVSLKILSEEISKGAEISPALTAPEEVTNLFPDMKNLPMIESQINKLENK